jgi:demethylmenaquinone methyltransferase/2-methoxy-6-polyprenyl-1,4-benzoquinol methylase
MTSSPTAQEIKTLFNQIAPVYDSLNDSLSLGLHRIWKLMTVKWSNPSPTSTALDLCCGSGDLTFLLAKQVTQGQVFGIDFSAQLLEIAKQKEATQTLSQSINWLEGDVLDLPFPPDYFDCATMGYGLRNVIDIPQCLREIKRVLKPNAKVAILDFHKPANDVIAQSQKWYLDNIVVNFAESLGAKEEYAYIYTSLERFPHDEKQIQIALEVGYNKAIHYPILGGIMGVLLLTK